MRIMMLNLRKTVISLLSMDRNDCYKGCIVHQLSIKLIHTIEFLLKLLCVD